MKEISREMDLDEHPDGYWGDRELRNGKWVFTRRSGIRSVKQIRDKNPAAMFMTSRPKGEQ